MSAAGGLTTDELAFALAAGVVAFFSPCSVALVPAYIALYLPPRQGAEGISLSRAALASLFGLIGASAAAIVGAVLATFLRTGGVASAGFPLDEAAVLALALFAAASGALFAALTRRSAPGALRLLAQEARRGIQLGAAASLGFVTVFGAVGVLLAVAAPAVAPWLPYVALVTAGSLGLLGLLLLLGRSVSLVPALAAPRARGYLSAYLFGSAYALISSGCLLPIFLVVVRVALEPGTSAPAVLLAYAAGYCALMVALAVYIAVARKTTVGLIQRALPLVTRAAGAVVLATALYIIWFDATSAFATS